MQRFTTTVCVYSHSLKNHEAEDFVEPMFEMGRDTLALPFEEKMKYWQGNKGDSFGSANRLVIKSRVLNRPTSYKVAGATYADLDGSTDLAEFINVSKDDAFAYPKVVHKVYPPTVNVRMKDAVKPFIQSCADASRILIDVFNQKLGLPEGTLAALHRTDKECISESRCIKVPPPKDTKIALGQHTDFGRCHA